MKRQFILFILPWLLTVALPHSVPLQTLNAQGNFHSWADLYLSPGSHLLVYQNVDARKQIANNGHLSLTRNWCNTPGFTMSGSGEVSLNGSISQRLKGWNVSFPYLNINNSAGIVLDSGGLSIRDSLVFQEGNLFLDDYDLTMQNGAPILDAGPDQFVVTDGAGGLSQSVGAPISTGIVSYPIGSEAGSYTPCTVDNGLNPGEIRCLVFEHVYTPPFSPVIGTDSFVDRTWVIESLTGNAFASVDIYWGDGEMLPGLDTNACGVAYSTPNAWITQSIGPVTRDPNGLFHAGYTGFQSRDSFVVTSFPVPVGRPDPTQAIEVNLFPNPATAKAWVEISGAGRGDFHGELIDSKGTLVSEFDLEKEAFLSLIELDLSNLPTGLFFLKLTGPSPENTTHLHRSDVPMIFQKLLIY